MTRRPRAPPKFPPRRSRRRTSSRRSPRRRCVASPIAASTVVVSAASRGSPPVIRGRVRRGRCRRRARRALYALQLKTRMRRCEFVPGLGARVVAPQRRREKTSESLLSCTGWGCSLAGCERADADAAALLLRVSADRATRSVAFFRNSSSLLRDWTGATQSSLKVLALRNAGPLTKHISSPASPPLQVQIGSSGRTRLRASHA